LVFLKNPGGHPLLRIILTFFQVILLLSFFFHPAAVKAAVLTDKRLNELSFRLNSFEAYWNRFQIGGDITLKSSSHLESDETKLNAFNFHQQLGLFLDAAIDSNLSFSVKLSHYGGWGQNYQSVSSASYPMTTPLQLDEAFLRFEYPKNINYLGRFRFSPTPLGLISDFSVNPIEGIAAQKAFGPYHGILIYSRVNTEYQPGTERIASNEDYWSARFGWSRKNNIFGVNIVPNGISGEQNFSLDWSYEQSNLKIMAEAAWYSFHSAQYPLYEVGWTPGLLFSLSRSFSKDGYYQIKAGYLAKQFFPSYSSLAHSAGDNREWFLPNMQGLEFFIKKQLWPGWSWENRWLFSQPTSQTVSVIDYRLSSSVRKFFSPINQLQFGIELKDYQKTQDNRIFLSWNLRF
jgi:hypothetical protein